MARSEYSDAEPSREGLSRRPRTFENVLIVVSALLLVSLVIAHLTVISAMRDTFSEFDVALPEATQIALSGKWLAAVAVIGASVIGGAALCVSIGKRALAWVLVALSVFITFAASTFVVYAVSLPASTSVVPPETERAEPPSSPQGLPSGVR